MSDSGLAVSPAVPSGSGGVRLPALCYAALGTLLFALLFHDSYRAMWGMLQAEDYNHCIFVPLIVAYLVWEKRSALGAIPSVPSWAGVLPLMLGTTLYWLGELGGEYYSIYLGSWFVLLGLVWAYTGWPKLRVAIFPVCFLISLFPFPNAVTSALTLKLKLVSSQLGVALMRLFGLSAYREGNLIDLGFTKLQVVDACSGLRYFFPLIMLAILLAYYYKAATWKKVLLVLSAVPVSVLTNSLRIASVGLLYQVLGPMVATATPPPARPEARLPGRIPASPAQPANAKAPGPSS